MPVTPVTLLSLETALSIRLNDAGKDDYVKAELDLEINTALHRAMAKAHSHKAPVTITLVENEPTYSIAPIHEVIAVGGLVKGEVGEMGIADPAWAEAAADTPKKWLHESGSLLRVHPKPNAAAVGTNHTVWGYADCEDLVADADPVTQVSSAFARTTLLEDAESVVRRFRQSVAFNLELAAALRRDVEADYDLIRTAAEGRV